MASKSRSSSPVRSRSKAPDAIALLKRTLHFFEHGLDRHFGLGLGDAGAANDFIDDVEFNQTASKPDKPRLTNQ